MNEAEALQDQVERDQAYIRGLLLRLDTLAARERPVSVAVHSGKASYAALELADRLRGVHLSARRWGEELRKPTDAPTNLPTDQKGAQ